MDPSEAVSNFVAITGAETDQALHYLEASNYNLDQAVALFFEGGASRPQSHVPTSPPPRATTGDTDVRSPIPEQASTLYDDFAPRRTPSGFAATMEQHMNEMLRQASGGMQGLFGGLRRTGQTAAGPTTRAPHGRSRMFPPPTDIMYRGTYENAIDTAAAEGKWVLINIQGEGDFSSEQLNRDTWANENVKALLQVYFIFWQADSTSEDGASFMSFYNVTDTPYICIIDPRSRETVKQWNAFIEPHVLAEQLTEFLDRYSLEDTENIPKPTRPIAPPPQYAQATQAEATFSAPIASGDAEFYGDNADDDLVAAAIQASLDEMSNQPQTQVPPQTQPQPQPQPQPQQPAMDKGKHVVPTEHIEAPVRAPTRPQIDVTRYVVQTAGPDATRVQLRLADGRREVRALLLDSPTAVLYQIIRDCLAEDVKEKPFRVVFFDKTVPDELATTLRDMNITNASLAMHWE